MRRFTILTLMCGCALILCFGCKNQMAINYYQPESSQEVKLGLYSIKIQYDERYGFLEEKCLLKQLQITYPGHFVDTNETVEAEKVLVSIERQTVDHIEGLKYLNNVISLCTFFIWPCIESESYDYNVSVKNDIQDAYRRFRIDYGGLSSICPLGLIPYPGIADWRSSKGDFNRYERNVLSSVIVDALKQLSTGGNLTATQLAIRDVKLKPFAIAEVPIMWETVQQLRVELDVMVDNMKKLEREFKELGRNPEEDADYRRLKALVPEIKGMHDRVYGKIEDAYLAAEKFKATPGRKDYAELRRKAIENGINDAEMVKMHFDELQKNK